MSTESVDYRRRLRQLREQRGWSQAELAAKAGVSSAQIGYWERGTSNPSLAELLELCRALGVSVHWFLSGEGPQDLGAAEVVSGLLGTDPRAAEPLGRHFSAAVLREAARLAAERESHAFGAVQALAAQAENPALTNEERARLLEVVEDMCRRMGISVDEALGRAEKTPTRILDPAILSPKASKDAARKRRSS